MTRLQRPDLDLAVNAGILSAQQADRLAEFFDASPVVTEQSRFSFVHVLYYLGGMIAIGAMSLFMTLGWNALGATGKSASSSRCGSGSRWCCSRSG